MKKFWQMILKLFGIKEKVEKEFPDGLIWLGLDVSGWKKTANCVCNIAGKAVSLDSDMKNVWPVAGKVDRGVCNANAWIIFPYKGKTYAATWEWMAKGQSIKKLTDKLGTYIKKSPTIPSSYHPSEGEKIGLFVSGLCRDASRNVSERSNICWITWK